MILLNDIEVRIIGSLLEKRVATPEYYPLSLNALTNACNQKSSREPVYSLNENEVEENVNSLRDKKFVRLVADGSRVAKFKEAFTEEMKLTDSQAAVMCVVMLRGPQTLGEIRSRSGRLFDFKSLEEVENVINELVTKDDPLIAKLERQSGMKERRFAHLLSGMPVVEEIKVNIDEKEQRILKLEEELEKVKDELINLKEQFEKFKLQFE